MKINKFEKINLLISIDKKRSKKIYKGKINYGKLKNNLLFHIMDSK